MTPEQQTNNRANNRAAMEEILPWPVSSAEVFAIAAEKEAREEREELRRQAQEEERLARNLKIRKWRRACFLDARAKFERGEISKEEFFLNYELLYGNWPLDATLDQIEQWYFPKPRWTDYVANWLDKLWQ